MGLIRLTDILLFAAICGLFLLDEYQRHRVNRTEHNAEPRPGGE